MLNIFAEIKDFNFSGLQIEYFIFDYQEKGSSLKK